MGKMSILNKLKRAYRKYRFYQYRKLDERNRKKNVAVTVGKRPLIPQNMPDNLNEISGIQKHKLAKTDELERASEYFRNVWRYYTG